MRFASAVSAPGRTLRASAWLAWSYRLYPLVLLPALLFLSRDFGNTWDEKIHQIEGEIAWDFWHGIPLPEHAPDRASHLYGALFDVVCVAAQRLVPGDIWTTRHYVNAAFGWLGIVYAGRLAARLFGQGAGLVAMVLLTLAPRYLGDLPNNAKDVPFAALFVAALYHLAAVEPRPPYLSNRALAAYGLFAAAAIDVRAGGLLLLGYLGAALAVAVARACDFAPRSLASVGARAAVVALGAVLLGTVFWPWAFQRPFVGPFLALRQFSAFFWNGTVLFDGQLIRAKALPWDYVPVWLAISTPPVLLAGLLLSLGRLRREPWALAGLWGAALFPIVSVIAAHSTLYNGVRHLLFVLPPLAVLAAAGWTAFVGAARGRWRWPAAALLGAGLLEPLVFCARNHPNEIVYFNGFVGGPRGAFGRYDLDYWGNCVLQEVSWSDRVARASRLPLVVSGQPPHVVQFDSGRFETLSFTGPEEARHHLEIAPVWGAGDDARRAASGPDVVHWTGTADGAVLCVTRKGPRFGEVAPRLDLAVR